MGRRCVALRMVGFESEVALFAVQTLLCGKKRAFHGTGYVRTLRRPFVPSLHAICATPFLLPTPPPYALALGFDWHHRGAYPHPYRRLVSCASSDVRDTVIIVSILK